MLSLPHPLQTLKPAVIERARLLTRAPHRAAISRQTPARSARRPRRSPSRQPHDRSPAQPILECGGSAAAFPKQPAPEKSSSAKRRH